MKKYVLLTVGISAAMLGCAGLGQASTNLELDNVDILESYMPSKSIEYEKLYEIQIKIAQEETENIVKEKMGQPARNAFADLKQHDQVTVNHVIFKAPSKTEDGSLIIDARQYYIDTLPNSNAILTNSMGLCLPYCQKIRFSEDYNPILTFQFRAGFLYQFKGQFTFDAEATGFEKHDGHYYQQIFIDARNRLKNLNELKELDKRDREAPVIFDPVDLGSHPQLTLKAKLTLETFASEISNTVKHYNKNVRPLRIRFLNEIEQYLTKDARLFIIDYSNTVLQALENLHKGIQNYYADVKELSLKTSDDVKLLRTVNDHLYNMGSTTKKGLVDDFQDFSDFMKDPSKYKNLNHFLAALLAGKKKF